MGPFARTRTNW
jgi:hypothetical protein